MSGGNKVQLGGVIVYLLFTTTLLIVFVRKLRKMAKDSYSALISSELVQWEVSLKQSIFALVSYLVSTVILFLSYDSILPFIDPIVLIFFIILTFTTVLKEMLLAFKEVIGMRSVSVKLTDKIEENLAFIVEKYGIKDSFLRVNKVGSVIVVEVDFLVDKDFQFSKVHEQDEIREDFEKSLLGIEYELWLSIAFTTQYKWIL